MAKAVKQTKPTPEANEAKTISENVDATFDKMQEMAEKVIIDSEEVVETEKEITETEDEQSPELIESNDKIEETTEETKNIVVDGAEVIENEETEKSESVKADGYSTDELENQDASGDVSTDDSEDDSEEEKTVEPLTEGEILEQIKELIKVEHNFNYVSFGRHLKNELTSENLKLFADEFKSSGMLTTPNHYKLMSLFASYFAETK